MGIPTINPDASLALVLEEITFTPAVLAANPHTKTFAFDFDPVALQWTAANEQEIQLRIALVRGAALIYAADDELDELVDAISQAVLLNVKGDRTAPQYRLYFGAKTPGERKRPVLSQQLEAMRGWIPSLLAASNTVLMALGARLQLAVAAADAAVLGLAKVEQENREFRTVGPRRALVDNINALRKSTYGKLAKMPHAEPGKHLPVTFADGFFRHQARKTPGKPTAAELAEQIAALDMQSAALKELLVAVSAEEEAAAKAEGEAEALGAAIAEAEKTAADAAAKVAALKARKKK